MLGRHRVRLSIVALSLILFFGGGSLGSVFAGSAFAQGQPVSSPAFQFSSAFQGMGDGVQGGRETVYVYPEGRQILMVGLGAIFGVFAFNYGLESVSPYLPALGRRLSTLSGVFAWGGRRLGGAIAWLFPGTAAGSATTAATSALAKPAVNALTKPGTAASAVTLARAPAKASSKSKKGGGYDWRALPLTSSGVVWGVVGATVAHYVYVGLDSLF